MWKVWMNGRVRVRALVFALACGASVACGGDDGDDGPSCGTLAAPVTLELGGLQPALGSSVPNAAITHTFTVLGVAALFEPDFALPPTHTAGMPEPAELMVSIDTSGADVSYTLAPLRWTAAPANVEIVVNGLFQTQGDGCIYTFPSPLFSYAITPAN